MTNTGSNNIPVFLGLGNGTFQADDTSYATGTVPYAVRSADLNGDSKLDLSVANFQWNSISIFIDTDTSTSQ